MITVGYTHEFVKLFKKFEVLLQEEIVTKIELFKNKVNHKQLNVHKLHGQFSQCYSFSVNYKIRIVFEYNAEKHAMLLTVGDHDVYK